MNKISLPFRDVTAQIASRLLHPVLKALDKNNLKYLNYDFASFVGDLDFSDETWSKIGMKKLQKIVEIDTP